MSAATQGLSDVYLQASKAANAPGPQILVHDLPRKGPQGSNIFDIAQATALFEQTQDRLRQDIEKLRMSYVFANDSVTRFLSKHRTFPSVLNDALDPLRKFFGTDKIFRLEVSSDEDELRTFYVVIRWTGTPEAAAEAIDRFDDAWWLEHMTPAVSNLSFTCDLA